MDDETVMIGKDPPAPVESKGEDLPPSKIFNTSVRGWIALLLSLTLGGCMLTIVIAPYFNVQVNDRLSDQLLALFSAGFGGAVSQYFNQKSREGQK